MKTKQKSKQTEKKLPAHVARMLKEAEFEKSGVNQYVHRTFGRIHLHDFTASEVVAKLMRLGEVHKAHQIREALEIHEDQFMTFEPVT